MTTRQHDSPVSPWTRLTVELTSHNHGTREELQQDLQVAWLLLQSIYDGSDSSSCYLQRSNGIEELEVLSLSIDRSLTLVDHKHLMKTEVYGLGKQKDRCNSMIWQEADLEPEKWLFNCLKDLEMVLLVTATDWKNHNPDTRGQQSVHVLHNQSLSRLPEEEVIGRIETLKTILSSLVTSPTEPIGDVSYLSEHDRRQIRSWNDPLPGPPLDMTIPSGFAAQVQAQPDAPAIWAWDGEMSYKELDQASAQLASTMLSSESMKTSEMVLFNLRKSKWALVAALAILKSGKAIVPIDPSWPRARVDQIISIIGARLALCDVKTQDVLGGDTIHRIVVPLECENVGEELLATPGCSPTDLAFVLFSSGSTGVPKGMLREHATACTASFAHAKAMHLNKDSRVLQFANHVFDVAMLDFFTTLLVGGCVCIPSEIDRKDDLSGFIERSRANWVLLTPTVADLLDPTTVPSLQFVTLGGEAIKESTLQKWLQVCRVGINYGSAEVDVTHTRDVLDVTDIANVGRRLSSCAAYIVDPENPAVVLPVGALGELVISGPTMAREYLNAPSQTAQVFLPMPQAWVHQGVVSAERSPWMSRIYRMGDLFRQRRDGSLEFVSRKDFQVKVNGQKVELGDVESKLSKYPLIKQCVVLYTSTGPYAKRLVAVVQSAGTATHTSRHSRAANATRSALTFQSMTEFLSEVLPAFMLPKVLIELEDMPYTPTMKIDRNRLKNWLSADDPRTDALGEKAHVFTALKGSPIPQDDNRARELSDVVADIVAGNRSPVWESISGHDHRLVDIGLDSAQKMRLAATLNRKFGVRVSVETLGSQELSIRTLAAMIENGDITAADPGNTTTMEARRNFLQSRVAELSRSVLGVAHHRQRQPRHVLLTGATGYLGVQILEKLLKSADVASVTVLLRSCSVDRALDKVKNALVGNGCDEGFQDKLFVWLGDLSKPRLGLEEGHWRRLLGNEPSGPEQQRIDTIIHCGAVVNWTKSYEELEAANVNSTADLLRASLISPHVHSFVFISGGRYPDPNRDHEADRTALYTKAARGNGYAQSKLVAECLVDDAQRAVHDRSICIVSPAYLIGSRHQGCANQDDYLWRIAWASVRVGAYNADEQDQWLFIAEVDSVAQRVAAQALEKGSRKSLQIMDGLSMKNFWDIVSDALRVSLKPVSAETWLREVRQDMDRKSDHMLWPLAIMLNSSFGQLTEGQCPAVNVSEAFGTGGIDMAIKRNLEYLSSVGFFA